MFMGGVMKARWVKGMLVGAATVACVLAGLATRAPAMSPEEVGAATTVAREYVTRWGTVRASWTVPGAAQEVAGTESMRLAEGFAAAEIVSARMLASRWDDAVPSIRIERSLVATDAVELRGTLDVEYHYADTPEVESAIQGVGFTVRAERTDSGWVVTGFDSDLDAFRIYCAEGSGEASATAAGVSPAAPQLERVDEVSMLRPVAPVSRGFSKSAAAAYAKKFATAPVADRLFYTAGADCTNFVSQCVWAGYGGWVAADEVKTRANIRNKVRMVPGISYADPDGWYGGTGGGVSTWESVGSFYQFCSANKPVGPRAQAANNGAKWTSLPGAELGSVLQLRSGPIGAYKHSVIVSSIDTKPIGPKETIWNHTYASAHSSNYKNRRVSEFIAAFGGANCYMRRLTFGSAPFVR